MKIVGLVILDTVVILTGSRQKLAMTGLRIKVPGTLSRSMTKCLLYAIYCFFFDNFMPVMYDTWLFLLEYFDLTSFLMSPAFFFTSMRFNW